MTTVSIIILVLTVLALAVLLIVSKRIDKRIKQLEKDVEFLNAGYDALEKQGAEHYAHEGTLGSRIEFIESKMVKTTKKPSKEQ